MTTHSTWTPVEPDLNAALARFEFPLDELAAATIPAIVLRGAFPEAACRALVDRLIAEDLLYDPRQLVPEKFIDEAIPEGYYREGRNSDPTFAWESNKASGRTRIDIGTSLGYRGSNKEAFLAHAAQTQALFDRLFADGDNPIRLLYDRLEKLSRDKRVVTAREPDGRRYGPAIIRAHYGGYTYKPHFDSVRLREKRDDYAVHNFEHQFAGVLVLQNTQLDDRTAQCVLHRCLWNKGVDPHIKDGTFHDFARDNEIENVEVVLNAGDLYFFNTRCIHEVPGVAGALPRIVLATFIGYSRDRDEIFVWS
jgi:hypothetical protein